MFQDQKCGVLACEVIFRGQNSENTFNALFGGNFQATFKGLNRTVVSLRFD